MKHLMITVLMAASFGVHALEQVPPSCKGYYENPKSELFTSSPY